MAWWVEEAGRDGAQGCSALLNPAHQGHPGAGASLVKTPHNSALCIIKGSFIPLLAVTPVRTARLFSSLKPSLWGRFCEGSSLAGTALLQTSPEAVMGAVREQARVPGEPGAPVQPCQNKG